MLFKTKADQTLFHGKLASDLKTGKPMIVDGGGCCFSIMEVDFVIPDDEEQGARIREVGFRTHTPVNDPALKGGACN